MSVLRSRLAAPWAVACLIVALATCTPTVAASGTDLFVGTARDTIGNVLEGVEVLIASGTATIRPVAVTYSDDSGRFSVSSLRPGIYRIAAIKPGYLTFVGQIDTHLQSWIDVTLQPAAASGDGDPLPMTRAWPLRLPKRNILRETENTVDVGSADGAPAPPRAPSAALAPVSIQVDQLYAVRTSVESGDDDGQPMHGPDTRVALASAIGENGNLRFDGARATLGTSRTSENSVAPASRDTASVNVAFDYNAGRDDRLSFNAFYDQRDLEWSLPVTVLPGGMRQAQRSWGYGAEWSRQLDPASRIELRLQHRDSRMELPSGLDLDLAEALEGGPAGESVSHRSVAAEGSYEIVPASAHQLEVGFSAQFLDGSSGSTPIIRGARWQSADPPAGYTLGVEAQDTWHVSGPFSLLYGLGYKHSLAARDTSLVVPRLGGAWHVDGLAMRFLLSYHAVTDWHGSELQAGDGTFRPASGFGYDTEIQLPVTRRLTLTGSASYTPLQLQTIGGDGSRVHQEIDPTYLTDGNAAVKRNRLTLVRESADVQTYAEFVTGHASGTLAAVLPYDLPIRDLTQRRLKFENGRVGVRVHASGTHLNLQYRQVEEWSEGLVFLPRGSLQKSLELALIQDLMRRQGLGSWRLLMALQVASLEAEDHDQWLEEESQALLDAPNGELRAGLSVVF